MEIQMELEDKNNIIIRKALTIAATITEVKRNSGYINFIFLIYLCHISNHGTSVIIIIRTFNASRNYCHFLEMKYNNY